MSQPLSGPKASPALSGGDHAHLATPPDAIRWDLGERQSHPRPKQRLCVVEIAGRRLAIPAHYTRGIQDIGRPTTVPGSPAHILGLSHVRGQILPVVDLALFAGAREPKSPGSDPERNALLIRVDEIDLCLIVDEVVAFEPFDPSTTAPSIETDDADPWAELLPSKVDLKVLSEVHILDLAAMVEATRWSSPTSDPSASAGEGDS